MEDFEKLGVFYLGRPYDIERKQPEQGLVLYESKDLLTHAVCIGMTGSGKTGLCLDIIEEAAIDGIPVIAIDPKGDISNVLLTFPDLQAQDFQPWVNADDARRAGISVEQFAAQQAETWKKGLADWGQSPDRIKLLHKATDFAIYTPGSSAGLPVSVLKSFDAPPDSILADSDLLLEKINSTTAGILTLLGIDADPLKSREHILISTILNFCWKAHQNLDLQTLIQKIQSPPVAQIGALSVDSFFPAKDRFALAMSLNNVLAAPGFEAWLQGEPLDIDHILYTSEGKPKVSIFSIAHLNDTERMFFVSLLLNQMLSWMRAQSGTTSLRAILYMDEIFGFFPPTANPASKQPLLMLLKQARAFGLGVMLATQNPVDLDYKGLSNAGTWFIGRLQTERDKMRLLDGLEGVAAGTGSRFDRTAMSSLLAGLGNRIFLMNNVHDSAPVVFQSRWSLSYLRGPLSRDQIKQLMAGKLSRLSKTAATVQKSGAAEATANTSFSQAQPITPQAAPSHAQSTAAADSQAEPSASQAATSKDRPLLGPEIAQYFLPVVKTGSSIVYRPQIFGSASVRFEDTKSQVDATRKISAMTAIDESSPIPVSWDKATRISIDVQRLTREPAAGAAFRPVPAAATQSKNYAGWAKDFTTWLAATKALEVFYSAATDEYSKPGESERDFRIRLQQPAREQRDEAASKLRSKYAPKISALQEKIQRAQEDQTQRQEMARQKQMDAAISVGTTLIGAFMGRRRGVSGAIKKASAAARRASSAAQQDEHAWQTADRLQLLSQQLAELENEFKTETAALDARYNPLNEKLESILVKTKKTNISVQLLSLVWVPEVVDANGNCIPAWA